MSEDVIIVGAGIVGCACADALSAAGLQVTLIESGPVGGGATAAGMGHLVVMDDNAAELALTSRSLQLWRELAADRPAQHEYSNCGTLWIAADDEELEAAAAKQATLRAAGLASEMLDAAALYRAEPVLRPGLAGALMVPGDALVYPPKSAQILLERAQSRGARLVRARVADLATKSVVLDDGQRLSADRILLAAGMDSLRLLPDLPLRAKKGHLLITERYPDFIRHQLVELGYIKSAHASDGDSVAFNLQPRPTGQVLLGSSRQFDRADREIDQAILRKMLVHAAGFVPSLASLKALRCWTGVRAATPDGLPLLGPHPARTDLWLATGHEGLGITTALASAELLAAQILKHPSAIPAQPYLPERLFANHEHG
jgi:glycine/D-amino acid oxidase-like deaminating enzyme